MYVLTQVVVIILLLLLLYMVREMDNKLDELTGTVEEIRDQLES